MSNKDADKPTTEWATWALLKKWETNKSTDLANLIAGRLRDTATEPESGGGLRSFLVMTDWGTWGAGKTLAEACEKAKRAGAPATAKAIAHAVLNDDKPHVTSDGMPTARSSAAFIYLGAIGTLSSVMRAAKGGAAK